MKQIWVALCGLLFVPLLAHAQESWIINKFSSDITIEPTGKVSVIEVVDVDFGSTPKHGIYRDLPYVYTDDSGQKTYTKIEDITVMQDGSPAQVDTTRNSANIRIRVGDPNITVTGTHEYQIQYTAIGVLRSYSGYDELYWNATGNEWGVPITAANATVHVPAAITKTSCYQGALGVSTTCDTASNDAHVARFAAAQLTAGEGLTVAVGYRPGVIPVLSVARPPSAADVFGAPATYNIAGLIVLLGVGFLLQHWYRYGRDRYWQRAHLPGVRSDRKEDAGPERILPLFSHRTVVPEYDPPDGLHPAEVGVLIDERADTLDISAAVVYLASKGFLTITEIPKTWLFGKTDYEFARTEKITDGLRGYEEELLQRLFEDGPKVVMSDLKNSFYKDLSEVKTKLYKEVVEQKLFPSNPKRVRSMYAGLGVLLLVAGIGLFVALATGIQEVSVLHWYFYALGVLSLAAGPLGIALIMIARFMPRKTAYGRELYQRVLGYQVFISTTEKYRAKFLENEGLFFEVLPYAIVFGVTDKLAKAFKDMGINPPTPSWYVGTGQFQAAVFAASLTSFSASLGTAMASTPSGSGGGGGFSGGGFGGGGGGSW